MAWYNTGTIALTNGSATVTGSGTNFLVGAQIGEALYAPDGKLYEIQTINSATVITLASNYLGSTASGQNYQIIPTQSLVADLASDVTDLISDFADVRDYAGNGKFNDGAVGTPGITFTQDQDNGLYRIGSNNWALAAGGQKIVDISTSGINVTGAGTFSGAVTVTGNLINFNTGAGNAPYIQHTGNQLDIRGGTGSTRFLNNAGSQSTVTIRDTGNVNGSGLDVTGTVTADGLVTQATANTYPDSAAQIKSLAGDISYITNVGGDFLISNSSLSDQFVLSSAGNVGIGTSSIDGTLHVHTASAGTVTASSQADDLVIENSAEGGMTIITPDDQSARIRFTSPSTTADVGGASIFYRQNINKMSMGTEVAGGILALKSGAGSEGLLLDASGNLLVGTLSAWYSRKVAFVGTGGTETLGVVTASAVAIPISIHSEATSGDNEFISFFTEASPTLRGYIDYNRTGNQVRYAVSSDQRLKENISAAGDAGSTIDSIQVRQFDWKENGTHQEFGLVAQELLEVFPESVSVKEDPAKMMGVDYSKLVPMMLKEIQSLRARIAVLES